MSDRKSRFSEELLDDSTEWTESRYNESDLGPTTGRFVADCIAARDIRLKPGSRVQRYLDRLTRLFPEGGRTVSSTVQDFADFTENLRDLQLLESALRYLPHSSRWNDRLAMTLKGSEFTGDDQNPLARNTLFECFVSICFCIFQTLLKFAFRHH